MIVDDLGRIPMSQHLAATLARAASYADAQQHPEVTLEHLLLALAEDPDAVGVLLSSNIDLARLAGEVSTHIGQIDVRRDPNGPAQVFISRDLKRILEAAAAAARQGRRAEINGAIVLAAIVGDGKSTAAHLLRVQGLTFEQAIRALQRASATPAPTPTPPQGSTEDILATARERVQSRTGQPQPQVVSQPQVVPQPVAPPYVDTPTVPAAAQRPVRPAEPTAAPTAGRSPVMPQWEPAANAPPRDASSTQSPPPRPTPPPGAQPGASGQGPGYQMPPPQRMQPPSGAQPSPQPQMPRTGPPAPFNVPASGPQPSPQPMPQGGPPPSLGQPQNRTAPPIQQRPPQGGAPAAAPGPPLAPRQRAGAPGNVRVASGQLVENIPRRMRLGVSMVVEARVARSDVKAIAEGLQGGGAVYRHEVTVTKAMSVRLRSPDGGFFIETSSPETQWIENVLGLMADDFASWRWTITPRERGRQRLQLLISARTVGADGLTAETALPDQLIEVKVAVNYVKTAARWAGWMTAAVAGGVLARFGESLIDPLIALLRGGG